ncbi:hypothetical protein GCM10018772_06020 [Streptomyces fumanus]|uniref:Uncharacterized protein n=1 Tax=Streptomyces fumanus TaxID=67302 RepID=A0A919A388_9ACTN|nr:hypothetical protein GCM10018772_06020 [Streptomyces fumanus]
MFAVGADGVRLDPDVGRDVLVGPEPAVGHGSHLPARAAAATGTAAQGEPGAALAVIKPVSGARRSGKAGTGRTRL